MSSRKTLSFKDGYIFVTSLNASCRTMRKSKQLHLDSDKMAVMVWSGSATSLLISTSLSSISLPSSLDQLLKTFSSCMAVYSLIASLPSFGNALSSKVPQSFFLRHETFHFNLVQESLILFSYNSSFLSFNPPVSCLLCWNPYHLPGL